MNSLQQKYNDTVDSQMREYCRNLEDFISTSDDLDSVMLQMLSEFANIEISVARNIFLYIHEREIQEVLLPLHEVKWSL